MVKDIQYLDEAIIAIPRPRFQKYVTSLRVARARPQVRRNLSAIAQSESPPRMVLGLLQRQNGEKLAVSAICV